MLIFSSSLIRVILIKLVDFVVYGLCRILALPNPFSLEINYV